MPTPSSDAATGAAASAAITLDPGSQLARRPCAFSVATTCSTDAASIPKRDAYSSAEIVLPAAISAARSAALRTLRPKLRKTVVAVSAGPRSTARLIAAGRVRGGFWVVSWLITLPTCWGGLGWGPVQAEALAKHTIRPMLAAVDLNFTGN